MIELELRAVVNERILQELFLRLKVVILITFSHISIHVFIPLSHMNEKSVRWVCEESCAMDNRTKEILRQLLGLVVVVTRLYSHPNWGFIVCFEATIRQVKYVMVNLFCVCCVSQHWLIASCRLLAHLCSAHISWGLAHISWGLVTKRQFEASLCCRAKKSLNSKKYGVGLINYTHTQTTAIHSSTKVDGTYTSLLWTVGYGIYVPLYQLAPTNRIEF